MSIYFVWYWVILAQSVSPNNSWSLSLSHILVWICYAALTRIHIGIIMSLLSELMPHTPLSASPPAIAELRWMTLRLRRIPGMKHDKWWNCHVAPKNSSLLCIFIRSTVEGYEQKKKKCKNVANVINWMICWGMTCANTEYTDGKVANMIWCGARNPKRRERDQYIIIINASCSCMHGHMPIHVSWRWFGSIQSN